MKSVHKKQFFLSGIRDGLPIGAGYFAVSFSIGIMAKQVGLTPFQGFLASILTNASAGEYAGFMVIKEDSGFLEMFIMTVVASARYFLMACALSQRFNPQMKLKHRFLIGFDLTDEIFGVQISKPGYINPVHSYGLFILPLIGWSFGTTLGIIIGNLLPSQIVNALSVSLYGMFIAIIIPPAKHNRVILLGVTVSFALSYLFSKYTFLSKASGGTRTIVLTIVIAGLLAVLFPIKEENSLKKQENEGGRSE